jgi:hypothetical protein
MTEPTLDQLILVPGRTPAEVVLWGSAVLEYAAAFPGVTISHDYADVGRPEFERLTLVLPDYWPDAMWALLKQNPRRFEVEQMNAPTPEVLAEILHARVYYGLRFGFQTVDAWAQVWPLGFSLIGLHGRADGEMMPPDIEVSRTARVEAVKLTSHATSISIGALRAMNPGLFIMVRPIMALSQNGQPRRVSASEFVDATSSDLQRLFDADPSIQYVEVHNEPNLAQEGLGGSWANGAEFSSWLQDVMRLYRQKWPYKKYGFPGLSPGDTISGVREGMRQFLSESALAAARADWVGVHGYWQTDKGMTSPDDGYTWQVARQYFPDKLLLITEFGNPSQPKNVIAQQYAKYYGMLRHVNGLGVAFGYVASTSDPVESARWAWRDEAGRDVGIAHEVGLRRHIH